ncbi:SUF system Fe-S cluster assembly regulator [Lacibacterium aquatile]|uniref:SUF system Fe-S cluster assembly regulator n=1 Tax=Lacibacterium aquatile TaxID=1168082 RepID=A0ABW5DR74_9PROT
MILVSKLADYAVVLATRLAVVQGEASLSAQSLADATRLPAATVAKVLKALAKAEIVIGARGATGGYRLARPPRDITVADLVAAIDGPLLLTECSGSAGEDHGNCEHQPYCGTKLHWGRINTAVSTALAAVTLQDMMSVPDFMAVPSKNDETKKENKKPQQTALSERV